MDSLLKSFLTHLKTERRLSEHSITAYKTDLTQLWEFVSFQYDLSSLAKAEFDQLRSWIIDLKETNIGNKSIGRKMASLNTFYRYLIEEDLIDSNPCAGLTVPKKESKLPTFYREAELSKLFTSEIFSADFEGERDKLMLELLYATGIRVAELIGLKEQDVSNNLLRVLGKGN